MNLTKQKRHQSKKLTKSARGQECLIRSPVCNGDSETTVLCHLNGGGMATKKSDLFGAFGCSACHSFVDGDNGSYSPHFVQTLHYEGVFRTQQYFLDNDLVTI